MNDPITFHDEILRTKPTKRIFFDEKLKNNTSETSSKKWTVNRLKWNRQMDAWLIDWFGSNLGVHWKWEWKWNGNEVMDWYENTWKWMKMSGNEKTELKMLKNSTLSDNWNAYDPFGEGFFFAGGPFLKHWSLPQAFLFTCILFFDRLSVWSV